MSTFRMTFSTDNDAFVDDPATEIETVMATTLRKIYPGGNGPVRDRNGNTIGEWSWA